MSPIEGHGWGGDQTGFVVGGKKLPVVASMYRRGTSILAGGSTLSH